MILGKVFRQELDCDKPAESQILRLAHHSHSAATQLVENAVVRDRCASQMIIIAAAILWDRSISGRPRRHFQSWRIQETFCPVLNREQGFYFAAQAIIS